MQTNPRVYRFSGLIAVLGLLALLIGFIVMLLLPSIRYAAWGILVLGILLLATAFIIDFRRVSRALTGRRGRFGVSATVITSIFIGIILLVNAISIGNYHRFDVTGLAQFTLTSQTKEFLGKLETPVQVLAFYIPGESIGEYAVNLLEEYQNYTDQLSLESIDPAEHPDMAREYGTTLIPAEYRYPAFVFEGEDGRRMVLMPEYCALIEEQIVPVETEHAFTSAILEVTGTIQRKVYFLTGHGESDIYSDYSYAREELLDNLFKVEILNLQTMPSIPEDCAALIIAAPQQSLASSEVDIIQRYLESGKQAMILTNPNPPPEINQLLSSWGVSIEDGTIIDSSSYVSPNKDTPLVTRERNYLGFEKTYFPGATAIIPHPAYTPKLIQTEEGRIQIIWTSEDSQIKMSILLATTEDSWLEKDFEPLKEAEFNKGIDLEGPLFLGFLIFTPPTGEADGDQGTALIVIGDSDFASNEHFYSGNNGNLFLNAVRALTSGTEIVTIEHKVLPFRRLIVSPEAERFISYSSIGLLPLLALVIGGVVWWRRR
jgi:hypothetical protein